MIKIKVVGCVRNAVALEMNDNATIGEAIDLAGGFDGQGMQPTGVISIRRKTDHGVRGLGFNYKESPSDLESQLMDLDTIVVQFDVESLM